MSKAKRFFDISLIFFLLLSATLLVRFALQWYQFSVKSRFVKVENISYYLLETPLKRVRVGADFSYQFEGKTYTGQYTFSKKAFINEYGAREWVKGKKLFLPYVYLNPKSPTVGILERHFPFKAGFQLILSIVAIAYFGYLKNYVLRYVQS